MGTAHVSLEVLGVVYENLPRQILNASCERLSPSKFLNFYLHSEEVVHESEDFMRIGQTRICYLVTRRVRTLVTRRVRTHGK